MKFISQIFLLCFILLSVNSQPSITWQRVFPNVPGSYSYASGYGIQPADNGGFYFINACPPLKTQVIKLDAYGNTIWSRIIDSVNCTTGVVTSDGGYLVTGINNKITQFKGDFSVKFSSSGNLVWNKTVDNEHSVILKMIKADNNTFVMCGYTTEYGLILALDSLGNLKWKQHYPTPMWKNFWTICKAYNGGYLAAGYYSESEYTDWVILTRIDGSGNIIWEKKYDTVGTYKIYNATSIQQYSGGYIFTPLEAVKIGTSDTKQSFIKIDSAGNLISIKVIPEDHFKYSPAGDLRIINPNKYLVCGSVYDSTSDTICASIIITDSSGIIKKKHLFKESNAGFSECYSINSNDFVLVGISYFLNPEDHYNAYVVRTDTNFIVPYISVKSISNKVPNKYILHQNYPNPFNCSTIIEYELPENVYVELSVYDILGRKVIELVNSYQKSGKYDINVDMNSISTGIYFYTLKAGNYRDSKKLVLVK
jgi:hypothetical protein